MIILHAIVVSLSCLVKKYYRYTDMPLSLLIKVVLLNTLVVKRPNLCSGFSNPQLSEAISEIVNQSWLCNIMLILSSYGITLQPLLVRCLSSNVFIREKAIANAQFEISWILFCYHLHLSTSWTTHICTLLPASCYVACISSLSCRFVDGHVGSKYMNLMLCLYLLVYLPMHHSRLLLQFSTFVRLACCAVCEHIHVENFLFPSLQGDDSILIRPKWHLKHTSSDSPILHNTTIKDG